MNKDKLAIVTPTHKNVLSHTEVLRITNTLSSCKGAVHYFLVPNSLEISELCRTFFNSKFLKLPDWYFRSIDHYNILMLQESLYMKFNNYEYLLICQLDAIVVGDISQLFSFDYFGASWVKDYILTECLGRLFVNRPSWLMGRTTTVSAGNGGLSLRHVAKSVEMIKFGKSKLYWNEFERVKERKLNEDVIFSLLGTQLGFRVPSREEANRYFVETNPFDPKALGDLIGFHALEKYQPGMEELLFKELNI